MQRIETDLAVCRMLLPLAVPDGIEGSEPGFLKGVLEQVKACFELF